MAMRLVIRLPLDRARVGDATLIDAAGETLGQWACRGVAESKAAGEHNNPARATTLPFGNTPSGEWRGCRVTDRPHEKPNDGIGLQWIPLNGPIAGDAVVAKN